MCWGRGLSLFASCPSTQGRTGRDEGAGLAEEPRRECYLKLPVCRNSLSTCPSFPPSLSHSPKASFSVPFPIPAHSCAGSLCLLRSRHVFPEPCRFAFPSLKYSWIGLCSFQCFLFPPFNDAFPRFPSLQAHFYYFASPTSQVLSTV